MFKLFNKYSIYALDPRVALGMAAALFVAVAAVDYVTTYELSFSAFYLFIVLIASWNCGWRWGLSFAVLALVVQMTAGASLGNPYSRPIYFYIDNVNRAFAYLLVVGLSVQLRHFYDREKATARIDYLTGALNNKGFYEALDLEITRHQRHPGPFCVAYLDCDNFKSVNDTHGHKKGDRLLQDIVLTLEANLRANDVVARLGGDEFALILPMTGEVASKQAIDKIRHALNDAMARQQCDVTFSIGVGIFDPAPPEAERVVAFTDRLMYHVKNSTKDDALYEVYPVPAPERAVANS